MTEPTIKMSKAALISLLQTRNEQLDAAEPTTEDIQEWYDGNWRYICIPDKNTLIGILLKRLKDAEQTHKTLLVCAMDDQDKLEAAEQTINRAKSAITDTIKSGRSINLFTLRVLEILKEQGDG